MNTHRPAIGCPRIACAIGLALVLLACNRQAPKPLHRGARWSKGIYRSADNGKSWRKLSTPLRLLSLSDQTMIGSGVDRALWRSRDGGTHWQPLYRGSHNRMVSVRGIWGDPRGNLFAVGDFDFLLRKPAGSSTWTRGSTIAGKPLRAIWGTPSGTLYVVQDRQILASSDHWHWKTVYRSPTRLHDITGDRRGQLVAVGQGGTMAEFTNGRWSLTPSSVRSDLRAVWTDGSVVYAVGDHGVILRRKTATSRFERVAGNAVWSSTESFVDVWGNGRHVVLVSAEQVWQVDRQRGQWRRTGPRGATNLVAVSGSDSALFLVAQDNRVWESRDAGKRWRRVHFAHNTTHRLAAIWVDPQGLPAIGGDYMLSAELTRNWQVLGFRSGSKEHQAVRESATLTDIWGLGSGRLFLTGFKRTGGFVAVSDDLGRRWTIAKQAPGRRLLAIWGDQQQIIAVGEQGTILRSDDRGRSWTAMRAPTSARLSSIHGTPSAIAVAGSGGTLLISRDGGRSWTVDTPPPDHELLSVHWRAGALFVLARPIGKREHARSVLFIRREGATTWSAVRSPAFPLATPQRIWSQGPRLYLQAGDYRAQSSDNGRTWRPCDAGSIDESGAIRPVSERWLVGCSVGFGDWSLDAHHVTGIRLARSFGPHGVFVLADTNGAAPRPYETTIIHGRQLAISLSPAAITTESHALALWAKSSTELLVVGRGGMIKWTRDAGKTWLRSPSEVTADLYLVAGNARGTIIAAGEHGTLLRYDSVSQRWRRDSSAPHHTYLQGAVDQTDRIMLMHRNGVVVFDPRLRRWSQTHFRGASVFAQRGKTALLVGDTRALLSRDGGRRWQTIKTPLFVRSAAIAATGDAYLATRDALFMLPVGQVAIRRLGELPSPAVQIRFDRQGALLLVVADPPEKPRPVRSQWRN